MAGEKAFSQTTIASREFGQLEASADSSFSSANGIVSFNASHAETNSKLSQFLLSRNFFQDPKDLLVAPTL